MKKTITLVFATIISLSAFSQQQELRKFNKVHFESNETDSTVRRLLSLSNMIAQTPELTQGKAGEMQKLIQDALSTIIRKEEKPETPKEKEKPKQ